MEDQKVNILIIGPPRSGTTLIAAMIGRHSDAAIIFEPKEMISERILSKRIVGQKLCIPNQIELYNKNSLKKRLVVNRLINIPFIKNIVIKYKYPLANFSIQDHLRQQNSKVIAVIRDGNDVISSIMSRGNQSFEVASYRWNRAITVINQIYSEYNKRILIVSFENIVQAPEAYLREISKFLKIEYEPQMLDGYKFTPIYTEEKGIDKNKAFRAKKEKIDFKLEDKFPDTLKAYHYLQKQC